VPDPRPDLPPSSTALLPEDAIVILFVVDALRADVVMTGKYASTFPEIEALRRESVELTHARSPAPGTIWALSSIFSSRYYSQLYWSVKPNAASPKVYTHEDTSIRFPEVLARAGIATVSSLSMPDVTNAYGTARGFTDERRHTKLSGKEEAHTLVSTAIERLRDPKGGPVQGPMFLYVHLLDAHSPYDRGGNQGSPYQRYLREVAIVDAELGRLRKAIAEGGLSNRTAIVFTADHGEAFGEYNTQYHGVTVYEELLRVPLLVKVPGIPHRVVERDVSLMDIAPTVLSLMGQPTPGSFMGESFVALLRGDGDSDAPRRPFVADSGRLQQAMIFADGRKVIRDRRRGTFELYDLNKDPHELHNLFGSSDVDAEGYLDQLSAFFYVHALRKPGYRVPYRP
jgi:arylsulfatase A-like enzyme